MKKHSRKRGFTDKLYFANLAFTWLYTILCAILTIFGSKLEIVDYSFINSIVPYIWAELGIHTSFIIWKAKCENISKYGNPDNLIM